MSGLSVRAFYARHGLPTASFYHWRRVLERRAAAEQPAFVPVQVVHDAVPTQASMQGDRLCRASAQYGVLATCS